MFEKIRVIGRGRLGSALVARLAARGHQVTEDGVQLIVLCVPDAVIADVAATLDPGPWICHMSGATPLSACAPHVKRFGVHPLQTFTRNAGAEQFDGAWGAISAETPEAAAAAAWLGAELGLRTFEIDEERRALYHMGATMASGGLVTLYRMAARACALAGAPPEALDPADAAHHRQRFRAHRSLRPRRLGHGGHAPARDSPIRARRRGRLSGARGRDGSRSAVRE